MTTTGFMRGVAVGVAAGAVIGMVAMPKKKNHGKKMVGKALKTAGELIDNVSGAMWF